MLLRTLLANWLRHQAQQQVLRTARDALHPNVEANTPRPPREIAVLFALDMESGGAVDQLANRLSTQCASHVEHAGEFGGRQVVLVDVGVGQRAAAAVARDTIAVHRPQWIIAAGFATALRDELKRGHVVMPDEIVDDIGARIAVDLHFDAASLANNRALHVGRLATVDHAPRTPNERRQLAEQHDALACDLESAGVAAACREAGVRFLAARLITETVEETLPKELEWLLDQKSWAGKLGAAAGAIVGRPSSVKDLWRLKEESIKASDRLAKFLAELIQNLPR